MTGIVKGRVEVYRDGSADVVPDHCPGADEHTVGVPRCHHVDKDGDRRSCPWWAANLSPNQRAERLDVSVLTLRATALGARTVSCQVLCHRQKANRPPGC